MSVIILRSISRYRTEILADFTQMPKSFSDLGVKMTKGKYQQLISGNKNFIGHIQAFYWIELKLNIWKK